VKITCACCRCPDTVAPVVVPRVLLTEPSLTAVTTCGGVAPAQPASGRDPGCLQRYRSLRYDNK